MHQLFRRTHRTMSPSPPPSPSSDLSVYRLTPHERRASFSLAAVYAVRMLGLFMIVPVFALEAQHYEGGADATMVGLALGLYGMVQAVLHLPLGRAADRYGRKRIMVLGLVCFGVGSLLGVWANTVEQLAWARAVQGTGAVSAAASALLSDLTRDAVRTKAMALVGASIGLSFALSLVLGPLLNSVGGLPLIFAVMAALAGLGIWVVQSWTPPEPQAPGERLVPAPGTLLRLLLSSELMRLNLGVFILHAVQVSTWVGLPVLLVQIGLPTSAHGWLYLPVVLLSFAVLGTTLFRLERRGHLRAAFLTSIGLLLMVQLGFLGQLWRPLGLPEMALTLFLFFCGFNVLEVSQPSQVSRLALPAVRATVMGVYNTAQSLGFFVGAVLGGWLSQHHGLAGVFGFNAGLLAVWLWLAWGMRQHQVNASHASTQHSNQSAAPQPDLGPHN